MKNVVKISILTATLAVAMASFSGCNKDNGPSLVSGSFNGRVSATVDPEGFDLSFIKYVVPWNEFDVDYNNNLVLGEQIGEPVSYSNNRFTINLPDPPPSESVWVNINMPLKTISALAEILIAVILTFR